jgi:hypothetical protein
MQIIITESCTVEVVSSRPNVNTDHHHHHHHHDAGEVVLPRQRVYTDHHHGDLYGSSDNSQGEGYKRIIITESCTGEVVSFKAKDIYRLSLWRLVWVKVVTAKAKGVY